MQDRRSLPQWAAVLLLVLIGGVAAGIVSALLVLFLHAVTWLSFGVLDETEPIVQWRRLAAPIVGAVIAALGWMWLRARVRLVKSDDAARAPEQHRMPLLGTLGDSVLQILLVSTGASLGREGAPRETSAAVMEKLALRAGISPELRGMFVAAAAGAGLAAVYHVPLAGVLFAVQVVARKWSWKLLAIALPVSFIATQVARFAVQEIPVYHFPDEPFSTAGMWLMLLAIPASWVVGAIFGRVTDWGRKLGTNKPGRLWLWLPAAGVVMGVAAWFQPLLLGNGIALTQASFDDVLGGELLLLAVAKMLLTTMFFAAGAAGGRLTPALAVGGAAGAGFASLVLPDPATVALAAIAGATGVLAISQRAGLFAAVFVWELTGADPWIALILVVVGVSSRLPAVVTSQKSES